MRKATLIMIAVLALAGCKTNKPVTQTAPNTVVETGPKIVQISTTYGTIKVRLYDETPKHRDNFVKLVKEGFYTDLLFHRVIKDFMIQGGDPTSKNAAPDAMLGNGGGNMERIPAEFSPALYHKKGVLAAARDNNPEKASSACQFYIVQGRKFSDTELDGLQTRAGITYTEQQRNDYKTIGGTPHLDMNYTVFGEVIEGLEVVDKIAAVETDRSKGDRPKQDVKFTIQMSR
jgi:cyclophilin family peptidyl-prolyl cis-trans isomerase